MALSLIVLCHGLWGNREHMAYIQDKLIEKYGDRVYILNIASNEDKYSYDGIDICGTRVVTEIMSTLAALKTEGKQVEKISMIGYSLGGLMLRYAVGILGKTGVLDAIEPDYFITFATPHLGVRSPTQSVFSAVFNFLSGTIVSRSGEQVQLVDQHGPEKKPLLEIMSEPDSIYYQHLARFRVRRAYANIAHDRLVPYWTAGLELMDYLHNRQGQLDIALDDHYCSIVTGIDMRTVKYKKQKMTKTTILRYSLLALSPLFAPIILILALSVVSVQGLLSRHRASAFLSDPDQPLRKSSHDMTPHGLLNTGVLEGVNLAENEEVTHATQSVNHAHINIEPSNRLKEISSLFINNDVIIDMHHHLTKMPWERVWVYIRVFNAHGNIVCRQKRFTDEGGVATVQHFIDTTQF